MAAAEHPLERALIGLSVCLGRAPAVPRTPVACAELLQALVTWAAPGPEGSDGKKIPARAAAALQACLLLLEAVRAGPPESHVTSAAGAGQGLQAEGSGGSALLYEGDVALHRLEGPQTTALSSQVLHVALESTEARTSAEETDVAALPLENQDGAPEAKPDCDLESVPSFSPGSLDAQWILRCATAPLLLLGASHSQDMPWTNTQSRHLAVKLLRCLLETTQCTSVGELLRGRDVQPYSTFGEALGVLGPRLHKNKWQSHPEAMLVFSWMLLQVPRPWLTDYLHRVIPPSLLLSDDYRQENKVLGIRCLNHIVKNVAAAELRQYNRAMVVYHALRNHLYTAEAEIIEVLLPCLMNLFPILHKPPPSIGAYQKDKENPADQVLELVLTHMEMEHKIVLRRLYAHNLPALQDRIGFRITRHMKRLLRVIVGYLEVSDAPEEDARLRILETLQGTIKYAWPRIPPRLPLLLKALLKLIYELSSESNQCSAAVTEDLLNGATECLLLLDNCTSGQVKSVLQDLLPVCSEPLMLKCIHRVVQST
ncbi:TELO2-interacting protein 2 [Leptodactylus fuscus]|uniref:TELO2-interacting protein 2 n=1 Tax=Leptodactylus fuscus TaxID=238119 RepID=UPI003F4E456B